MKILICDDHAIIRKGLKQILLEEYALAEIIEAADAGAAINLISKTTPDVVICDLSMPGRSGLDVVHYTRQNFPRIPVLILSIHPEEQYALRVLKAGAAGYLNKDAALRFEIGSGLKEKDAMGCLSLFSCDRQHFRKNFLLTSAKLVIF